MTEYCFFLEILFALWIYLHQPLYQEFLNIQNLNNLFVLTELSPTGLKNTLYIYICDDTAMWMHYLDTN